MLRCRVVVGHKSVLVVLSISRAREWIGTSSVLITVALALSTQLLHSSLGTISMVRRPL
jgi:hypothetical protein